MDLKVGKNEKIKNNNPITHTSIEIAISKGIFSEIR